MPRDSSGHDRLNSWKEIAAYVGRDVRTVIRWEQRAGLPVHRIPVGDRHAIHAYRSEIDAWMRGGWTNTSGAKAVGRALPFAPLAASPDMEEVVAGSNRINPPRTYPQTSHFPLPTYFRVWAALATVLAVAALIIHSLASPHYLEFSSVTQITTDGNSKDGLVTDGNTLYFGERNDAKTQLSSVSVNGGSVRFLATPFVNAIPVGISPDGRNLLVFGSNGEEEERPLWVVPVDGGKPHRLGTFVGHSAAWSSDGARIVFAYKNAIYLTNESARAALELQTFASVPNLLHWTSDGSGLRFVLQDSAGRSTLWKMTLTKGQPTVSSLEPLHVDVKKCCNSMSASDRAGNSFLGGGIRQDRIFLMAPFRYSLRSFRIEEMNRIVGRVNGIALAPDGTRLFVLSDSASPSDSTPVGWSDLVAFDTSLHEFRPFLSGVAAEDLDFSRDGEWIAWINPSDQTLWIGRADGSRKRQIQVPDCDKELPRWSPDGSSVAFMAKLNERPWRIFIFSVDNGHVVEASNGVDNQGAPTWSPDGKWLAYGNVLCEETNSCAIHKIELATGGQMTIPESEGLETARWSPNGRFIAALRPLEHEVFLFDVRTEVWRKLADGVSGNNLNWSADSRYLYASNPSGNKPEILQISPVDHSVSVAVDLSAFAHLTGRIDPWFAVAPDSSIIFLRRHEPWEVYALSVGTR